MKRIYLIFLGVLVCTSVFGANLRSSKTSVRQDTTTTRQTANRDKANVVSRPVAVSKTQTNKKNVIITRGATKKVSSRTTNKKTISARTATTNKKMSRAATNTRTFGTNYTTCRDAYFTCMDQFCATQNEAYRRCVCSSKLQQIQEQEKLLSQTSNSLQDFKAFNIDAIPKTAEEVAAMQKASEGEKSIKEDTSTGSAMLKNIKNVLNTTKQKSVAAQEASNITTEMKTVWNTTDLIHGQDIANLSGMALYNAVNAQCYEMVQSQCAASDLKMVVSAYGMYIENDCEILAANINNKTTSANAAIRTTRHDMQQARLENYNAHNDLSLHDCIAQVRQDITADTACGENYIHCLDVTGKYLNFDTGKPIYSPDFYQFENQISLSGDVLKNSKNKIYINLLNKKQSFAQITLDSCRDVSNDVWDEFLRQALVEISQAQQQRIQDVKQECLRVVNECYLNKSKSVKELSVDDSGISNVQSLEIAETMCTEKLDTCSNLYGGGSEGLDLLVSTMSQITDATIAQECPALLKQYVKQICAVPTTDSGHAYPYGCRTYAPGDTQHARNGQCNNTNNNPFSQTSILFGAPPKNLYKSCSDITNKTYKSCNVGFYLCDANRTYVSDNATACCLCNPGDVCLGGQSGPNSSYTNVYDLCGYHYIGSLYQKLVTYALHNCMRTTNETNTVSNIILMDITKLMTEIRTAMLQELSKECDKLDGIWVDVMWQDNNRDGIHDSTRDELLYEFYTKTNTHKLWGYCKPK